MTKFIPLLLLVLTGCGSSENKDSSKKDEVQDELNQYLEDHKSELEEWIKTLEGISELSSPSGDHDTEKTFDFIPVQGTKTKNSTVYENFNSIFLSTLSFGKEKPEGMSTNFFKCPIYDITNGLVKDEKIPGSTSYPRQNDDRFPSTGIAFLKATKQVQYVFLYDIEHYNKGGITATRLYPSSMKGTMYIYDMKNEQLLLKETFNIDGFKQLNYSYEENASYDDAQKDAELALKDENKRYYPEKIMEKYAPNNNYLP